MPSMQRPLSIQAYNNTKGHDMEPITIAIIAAVGLAAWALSRRKKPSPAEPIGVTLDGDSILYGPELERNVAATMRSLRPAWTVDDRGVGGLLLRSLIAGYQEPYPGAPPEVFPRGPQPPYAQVQRSTHFVVVEPGGNDAWALLGADEFEANMRSAINTLQAEGRVPILTGIVDFTVSDAWSQEFKDRRDEYNAITHRLATEYGLQNAGWGEDYQGPQDTIDGLHRTQEASDRLAAQLVQAVERAAG